MGEGGLGGVGEAGLGADGAEVAEGLVPGEGAEGDDHAQVEQGELGGQPGGAGVALDGERLVVGWGALDRGSDVAGGQGEAVVARDRGRLVGEAGAVEAGEQPVAGPVAGEDPAGAVAAVGGRGEAEDEQAGGRVAEPGERAGPRTPGRGRRPASPWPPARARRPAGGSGIPVAQSSQQQFVQYNRRLPHLLLRQALDRETTLRSLGQDTFEGKPHDVFTFVMADTQQVAVYVDSASGLVSKYELIFVDPFTGVEASEIMFGNYTRAGNFQVPQTWGTRQAGDLHRARAAQGRASIPPLRTSRSTLPQTATRASRRSPTRSKRRVEQLADGVFVIQNVAGQNQNTLAVAFKDYIVAVEAPGSSAGAEEVIKRIKAAIPGKPIRYVAMTHHHGDHIGGLRSFIAEGATVVTTQGNREVVETMAAAPQLDRLAKSPRKPEFLFLQRGKRVLTDGTRTLELIDIGPNPHAREMVVAYLPKERVVFQGDLFFLPANDAPTGPPQATTVELRAEAERPEARRRSYRQRARSHDHDRRVESRHAERRAQHLSPCSRLRTKADVQYRCTSASSAEWARRARAASSATVHCCELNELKAGSPALNAGPWCGILRGARCAPPESEYTPHHSLASAKSNGARTLLA